MSEWITKKPKSKWMTRKEPKEPKEPKSWMTKKSDLEKINKVLKKPTKKANEIFKQNYRGGGLAQRGFGRAFKKGGKV